MSEGSGESKRKREQMIVYMGEGSGESKRRRVLMIIYG